MKSIECKFDRFVTIEHRPSGDETHLRIVRPIYSGERVIGISLSYQDSVDGTFNHSMPEHYGAIMEWRPGKNTQRSARHICFVGEIEYFELDGDVHAARISRPFYPDPIRRSGTAICPISEWEQNYRSIISLRAPRIPRIISIPV